MRRNPNFDPNKIEDPDLRRRFQRPPPADGYMRGADLIPRMKIDPETKKPPVPKEGDDLSPFTCDVCHYEHNMQWKDIMKDGEKTGARLLVCYACDNFRL